MIGEKINDILSIAVREAQIRRHEYISVEHILFAILKDMDGNAIIKFCGADSTRLQEKLEEFF